MKRKGGSACSVSSKGSQHETADPGVHKGTTKSATKTTISSPFIQEMMNTEKVQAFFMRGVPHLKRISKNSMGSAVVFLGVFCLLCILDGNQSSGNYYYQNMVSSSAVNDATNPSAFFQKTDEKDDTSSRCPIDTATSPKHKVNPTFLASFPGSGSKLSWQMTQALTGMITTDDVFSNGQSNAVGIKTHYPCPEGKEAAGSESVRRVILFIRHPMDAIAAYHDFIFAIANNLTPGEAHAPYEHWIKWRDSNFEEQIKTWRKHLEYWMDRYSRLNRLVLPYEQFILEQDGPHMAEHMAEFLSRSDGVVTVAPEQIPCIWRTVVSTNMGSNGIRRRRQLRRRLLEKDMTRSSNRHHQQQQRALQKDATAQDQIQAVKLDQQQPSAQQQQPQNQEQHNSSTQQKQQTSGSEEQNENPMELSSTTTTTAITTTATAEESDKQKIQPNTNKMGVLPQMDLYTRPFADAQKKEIVVALAQLLEKYRDDKVLAPILVGYIDQVTASKQSV